MLYRIVLLTALLLASLDTSCKLYAQQEVRMSPSNIFDVLEAYIEGEGVILVKQSPELRALVGGISDKYRSLLEKEDETGLKPGFRIQVYNGNLKGSKAELEQRLNLLRRLVPEQNYYTSYNAPFWRLTMGDFSTEEQAKQLRLRLLKSLPAWFGESYIIKDRVRIVNNPQEINGY